MKTDGAKSKNLILALFLVFIVYFFLYTTLKQGIFSANPYDSYSLQAISWWKGRADLGQDYSWLELAYYGDKIYLSFPPFPSVVMFLLVPFFGEGVPSNLLVTLYAVASFIILYLFCIRRRGLSDTKALFWAGFAVFAGNLLSISPFGGVWYHAQTLSFFMCVLSLYLITSEKPINWCLALVFWAFAIGCRPFQILYFPLYVFILYKNLKKRGQGLLQMLKYLIGPIIVGALYALYNYIRFDSIFEFGHNYLPEFTQSKLGQFHYRYILENLPKLFRLPYFEDGMLTFPKFNGFLFFVANPIFICYFIYLVKTLRGKGPKLGDQAKDTRVKAIIILSCALLHIVWFLSHKTLGGWQFGTRYLVDLIPYIFFSITLADIDVKRYEIGLFAFGLVLNIYGTLWLNLGWAG